MRIINRYHLHSSNSITPRVETTQQPSYIPQKALPSQDIFFSGGSGRKRKVEADDTPEARDRRERKRQAQEKFQNKARMTLDLVDRLARESGVDPKVIAEQVWPDKGIKSSSQNQGGTYYQSRKREKDKETLSEIQNAIIKKNTELLAKRLQQLEKKNTPTYCSLKEQYSGISAEERKAALTENYKGLTEEQLAALIMVHDDDSAPAQMGQAPKYYENQVLNGYKGEWKWVPQTYS